MIGDQQRRQTVRQLSREIRPLGRERQCRLRLELRDEQAGTAFVAPGASVELTKDAGLIALLEPAELRVGARRTRVELTAPATFDGRALRLTAAQLRTDEMTARIDGALVLIAREPAVDVTVRGRADVAGLSRWAMEGAEVPGGEVAFDGRIAGPIASPESDLRATADRLAWRGMTATAVTARAHLTSDLVRIEQLEFGFEGGRVTATGEATFSGDAGARVKASASGLDAARLVRLLAPSVAIVPAGTLSGDLDAAGPLARPEDWTARGRVHAAPGANGRNRMSVAGDVRFETANGAWQARGASRLGDVISTNVALRGSRSRVTGTIDVAETQVPALIDLLNTTALAEVPADLIRTGTLRGQVRLAGPLDDIRLAFSAEGDALAIDAAGASGGLTANGTYEVRTERFTLSGGGTGWQVMPSIDLPLSGRLDLGFNVAGTVADPSGTGELTLRGARWQDVAVGDIFSTAQIEGRAARINVQAPDVNSAADARVGIDAPYPLVLNLRSEDPDLSRILRDLGAPASVRGTATFDLHAEGTLQSWRAVTATLDASSVEAAVYDLPIRLAEPAHASYANGRITIERLEMSVGETRMSVSGELPVSDLPPGAEADAALLVTMAGDVGEVLRAAAAAGVTDLPVTGGDGPVALLARVTGSVETPVVTADVELGPGTVIIEQLPPVSDVRLRAHVENGWIELRDANAIYQGATLAATGKAPLSVLTGDPAYGPPGAIELHARATGITPTVLEPFVDAATLEQLSGAVDATLDLASPTLMPGDLQGELRLDRLDLRIADLPVTQRLPTRIAVRDGIAHIESWDWVGQGATLALSGQVRLSDRQAAILANGVLDLRMLTPFVRDSGMTTAGTLQPRLSITGPLDSPRFDGDVALSGGEVRLVDPRVLVSDLTARAVLTGTTAHITSVAGTINGGPLTGDGTIELGADGRLAVLLSTDIRGMALEFPPGLRSEINALLSLALEQLPGQDVPSGRLTGTATIVRGGYREPLAVVTGLLASFRTSTLAAATEPSPFLDALALDVRLLTDEDISVDNNYGRFQLGGDLRVIGTGSAPALSGRADLREGGQLFVGRNDYTITAGTIDFTNPTTIEPELTVRATTRVAAEEIEVTITGTPETIAVDLDSPSNPDLGQAEIASLLLTGRRFEDLDPGDAAFVGTQVLGNFSAEVLGFASRAVGLDTLRLGGVESGTFRRDPTAAATEIDPTTRLTFGKSIGSNMDVTFSQSLRDGDTQTLIVDYIPVRRLEVRLVSADDDLRSYGFRHDMTFGAAAPRVTQSATASREAPRVSGVSLTGDLVLPEAGLLGLLRLGPGDRFDFGAWQADRDRLDAAFRREGYLTARVATTRMESGNEVALAYQIVPGPRTAIVVTGMDVDQGLRTRLEQAWSDAVFDQFAVDEAGQVVRDFLAGQGYLQAMVSATVNEVDDIKTLTVVVDRGQQVSSVSVQVMSGDDEIAGQVNEFLDAKGLADRAVREPGVLEREVTGYLRGLGHLRVRVTAGAPRFGAGTSVVPLTVDAGPVFLLSSVSFTGGERLPVASLRETAGLVEGTPFDAVGPEAARERLIALYRREGFPTPSVTAVVGPTTLPHRAGAAGTPLSGRPGEPEKARPISNSLVDVTFTIDEGPRQILTEVEVTGNRAIDADVIVLALALDVNQPLRAAESLQARSRVFDTGLFRRVDVTVEAVEAGDGDTRPMRLRVTVEEWPALRLRYGLQVAEERPEGQVEGRDLVPGLSADLTRRTLFGRAIAVGGAVELQRRERRGRAFVNAPTLAGWPIESSLVLERSREHFAAVTLVTDRQGIAWEQRTRVARALSLSYSYRFERNHTFETEAPLNPDFPVFDITINIARITGSAAWDTRDDPADTTRGSLLSSSLEYAPAAAGSDIWFVRELAQAYHFRSWRGAVLASAARVGVVRSLGDQELIVSERFFAGGARTVRGVAEDTLGTRDFFGDPAGGRALLVFNQEVRVPVYRWVRAVGFVDAGNVFDRWSEVGISNLVGSVGVGLRLVTPFALLRADYAKAMWAGDQSGTGRFVFGIGHAF